jgi:hypothetical protein
MTKLEFKRSLKALNITTNDLKFALEVGESAQACPEVAQFYETALINKTDANLFNNVPGVKKSKRIPVITSGNLLKPFACPWSDSAIDLNAKEIAVDKVNAMVEICVTDIEDSFEVWNMTQGANQPVTPQTFLNFIWQYIARKVRSEVEWLRWYGDKVNGANTWEKLTNGYITLMKANIGLVNVVSGATTITVSNVKTELYNAISAVPAKLHNQELNIFVSSNVYLAYGFAQADGNATLTHLENQPQYKLLGKYKIIEVPVLDDDTIVIAPKQDLVYGYDLEEENFIVADMIHSAEMTVRFRVNLYFGFDIYDYTNVTYYGPSLS